MYQFFKELLVYNHCVNQQLILAFKSNLDNVSEKSIQLFSHILNAHEIWNYRIDPKNTAHGVWDIRPPETWNLIDQSNYEHSHHIINKYQLEETTNYSTTKGQQFKNSIQDILFHIINHSTYHRAQIATEFKRLGLDPLNADYILFKR